MPYILALTRQSAVFLWEYLFNSWYLSCQQPNYPNINLFKNNRNLKAPSVTRRIEEKLTAPFLSYFIRKSGKDHG